MKHSSNHTYLYLKEMVDSRELELIELGKRFREEIVLPFCREHRCLLHSGNKVYHFYPEKNRHDCVEDSVWEHLKSIRKVMNQQIGRYNHFHYYVTNVRCKDL